MAIGDPVNGIGPINSVFNFQPAVGVTILITQTGGNAQSVRVTNGVIESFVGNMPLAANFLTNYKMFINNTNYLSIDAVAVVGNSYSGIQVQ